MEKTTNVPLSEEMMEEMMDEIASYFIELEEDPTQIHLGIAYLQKILAKSRSYINRTQFYMQRVKRYENRLRSEIKIFELDLDFKIKEKLADDILVRKQPSIEDRRALAITMLANEHKNLADKQVELQKVEECCKIIKSKYLELQRTSSDIKTQRNLVKDDILVRLGGLEGYVKPQLGKDKSVPEGLPPPVMARVDPRDILNDQTRPEDMPEPIDPQHAAMIADFLNNNPIVKGNDGFISKMEKQMFGEQDTPDQQKCPTCGKQQFTCPSGLTCPDGHGFGSGVQSDKTIMSDESILDDILS